MLAFFTKQLPEARDLTVNHSSCRKPGTSFVRILTTIVFLCLFSIISTPAALAAADGSSDEPLAGTGFDANGPCAACSVPGSAVRCATGVRIPTVAGNPSCSARYPSSYGPYKVNDTKDMYEQSVEDPCIEQGLRSPCNANDFFKPRIRVHIRFCVGTPVVFPVCSPFSAGFWSDADCWETSCGGYMASGSEDLEPGECSFIQAVRFCARIANPGLPDSGTNSYRPSHGNRTAIDPDYRTKDTVYSGSTPKSYPLTNEQTITIASNTVTNYTGNLSELDPTGGQAIQVLQIIPEGTLVVKGRTVDNTIPLYLKKVGSVYKIVSPRIQLCAFEDPGDFNDPAASGWQFAHQHTPGTPFKESNLVTGAKLLGVAAVVVGVLLGPISAGVVALAAGAMALVAAIQEYINYIVMQNEGCIDVPLSPYPPPYPDTIKAPTPIATAQAICSDSQTPRNADCVLPKAGEANTKFAKPRIRVAFNTTIVPLCSAIMPAQTPTFSNPCVNVPAGDVTSANIANIQSQFNSLHHPVTGAAYAPTSIRPVYTPATGSATAEGVVTTVYNLSGIATGDFADLEYEYQQDTVYKDYRKGVNSIAELKDPRSTGTTSFPKRKFFSCMTSDAKKICAYELKKLDLLPTSPDQSKPYPCNYVDTNDTAGMPITQLLGCSDRLRLPSLALVSPAFPTCTTAAGQTGQSEPNNCSTHTHPLLRVKVVGDNGTNQTLVFGTKPSSYIDRVITGGGTVNPVRGNPIVNTTYIGAGNYPNGEYAQCRRFYGIEFCTFTAIANGTFTKNTYTCGVFDVTKCPAILANYISGDEALYDTSGNYLRGIASDQDGYVRGASKLCLGGYEPAGGRTVLAKKRSGVVSTAAADQILYPYHQGDIIPDYAGRVPFSTRNSAGALVTDTTKKVINPDTEGTYEKADMLDLCVDVPAPLSCPAVTLTTANTPTSTLAVSNGNANWASSTPGIPGAAISGTCRTNWGGSPTRTCSIVRNHGTAEDYGVWGTVQNPCTEQKCPVAYTMIQGNAEYVIFKWPETVQGKTISYAADWSRNGGRRYVSWESNAITRTCQTGGVWQPRFTGSFFWDSGKDYVHNPYGGAALSGGRAVYDFSIGSYNSVAAFWCDVTPNFTTISSSTCIGTKYSPDAVPKTPSAAGGAR